MSGILNVTDNTFTEEVLNSSKPTIVDFWASWCGPCRKIGPILEDIAKDNPDIKVVKVDADANPDLITRYNIVSIPTLMFFKEGELEEVVIGAVPRPVIEQTLAKIS